MRLDRLVHHGAQVRLHDVVKAGGEPDRVALFLVVPPANSICETVETPSRAWIRQGLQNTPLNDFAREQLKRDRRVVDFERMPCTRFDPREIDAGVLDEFKDSYLTAASYEWADDELLYQLGAVSRESEPDVWTHAGTLFFSANPQRVMPQAHIRLLRFEVTLADRDERPMPTYEKSFGGQSPSRSAISGPSWPNQRSSRPFSAAIRTAASPTSRYPQIALDEAVANAVAHRDYAIALPIQCEK